MASQYGTTIMVGSALATDRLACPRPLVEERALQVLLGSQGFGAIPGHDGVVSSPMLSSTVVDYGQTFHQTNTTDSPHISGDGNPVRCTASRSGHVAMIPHPPTCTPSPCAPDEHAHDMNINVTYVKCLSRG